MKTMCRARRVRWSDGDRYFGPFTYAPEKGGRWRMTAVLEPEWGDRPTRRLRLTAFGHTLLVRLPAVPRTIRNREYGFNYFDGYLQVFYGRQTDDRKTSRMWSKFLPWTQWRHVRYSLYGLDGELYRHEFDRDHRPSGDPLKDIRERLAAKDACPSRTFAFDDFDGQPLTARTLIEEREWLFGMGWFRWLSVFRRPMIRRSLDIEFSGETGRQKGSWKGGLVGHGIDMLPGETHEAAFRRYCESREMTFRGETQEEMSNG